MAAVTSVEGSDRSSGAYGSPKKLKAIGITAFVHILFINTHHSTPNQSVSQSASLGLCALPGPMVDGGLWSEKEIDCPTPYRLVS